MKCPNCAGEAADQAAECPACGLLFAKWRERQEREKREAAEALQALESSSRPPALSPWIGRSIAIGLVAFWVLGLAIYYARHLPEAAPRAGAR